MFEDLGWENLELRKSMTRLNLLYKMSRGQIDIDVNSYLQPHSEVRNRGGHRYKYGQDMATKKPNIGTLTVTVSGVVKQLPIQP